MSVYFIASLKIKDEAGYQDYCQAMHGDMASFSGKYLALDSQPEVLEGQWNYTRCVLIEFESEAALRHWYDSPEYQAIIDLRKNSTDGDIIIAHGVQ